MRLYWWLNCVCTASILPYRHIFAAHTCCIARDKCMYNLIIKFNLNRKILFYLNFRIFVCFFWLTRSLYISGVLFFRCLSDKRGSTVSVSLAWGKVYRKQWINTPKWFIWCMASSFVFFFSSSSQRISNGENYWKEFYAYVYYSQYITKQFLKQNINIAICLEILRIKLKIITKNIK